MFGAASSKQPSLPEVHSFTGELSVFLLTRILCRISSLPAVHADVSPIWSSG